jgi:uncharacterized protein (TIGR02996 family)
MRDTFERAILANPDDAAGYAAYADWLQEQNDARGEFMAVQLALEDEARPAAERKELQNREKALLAAHEREWLGGLAPFLLDRKPTYDHDDRVLPLEHAWRWGFLDRVRAPYLTVAFAQALADAPAARLLRHLHLGGTSYYWSDREPQPPPRVPAPDGFDPEDHLEYFELIGADCLKNLRFFHMGDPESEPPEDGWADCHTGAPGLEHVVATMPRVEELHLLCKDYDMEALFALPNLSHLRVLRALHQGGHGEDGERYGYPLDVLAANPALKNLTQLIFHPHTPEGRGYEPEDGPDRSYLPLEQVRHLVNSPHLTSLVHLQLRLSDMGDAGVKEIIASGIMKRLKWLDLRHGEITDDGARRFAACPDAKNLDRLDLSRNGVTAAGLAALRAAGVNAVANNPLTPTELEHRDYLREGDFE